MSRLPRSPETIHSKLPEFDATGHHRQSVKSFRKSPADSLATEELRRQVRECIHRLPAPDRDVLILRDIEELDTEATASALGVSPAVVKTRLHRARHALRTLLEPILKQNSSIVAVSSTALESMQLGAVAGLTSLGIGLNPQHTNGRNWSCIGNFPIGCWWRMKGWRYPHGLWQASHQIIAFNGLTNTGIRLTLAARRRTVLQFVQRIQCRWGNRYRRFESIEQY